MCHIFSSLVGKKLECSELKKTVKYLNMTRQSPKARRLYKSTFNIHLKSSGYVRWFADWKLIADISEIGIDRILNEFVKKAKNNKWRKRSTDKILKYFSNSNDSSLEEERLAKVLVVSAVITNVGDIFCKSCYFLERYSNVFFNSKYYPFKFQIVCW